MYKNIFSQGLFLYFIIANPASHLAVGIFVLVVQQLFASSYSSKELRSDWPSYPPTTITFPCKRVAEQ